MAHFHKHPSGERLSQRTLEVEGTSLTIGLYGYLDSEKQEVLVLNAGSDLMLDRVGVSGDSMLWKITVTPSARATKEVVTDRIFANTQKWDNWDQFEIRFRFPKQKAESLTVRAITNDLFGPNELIWRSVPVPPIDVIDMASYRPNDPAVPLKFRPVEGRTAKAAWFAAKLGSLERSLVLLSPMAGGTKNLLVVITHSFGQNDKYYGALGYSDPLSLKLIQDVTDRFAIARWGAQMLAARSDYSLLLPIRAKGSDEVGPFASQSGIGAQIIARIIGLTGGEIGAESVDLVTFSNGIQTANQFLSLGGKGLSVGRACNQDPAGGVAIASSVSNRQQFLSGHTTGGKARAGFVFLPLPRWVNERQYATLWTHEKSRFNYLHTWCLPQYTLYPAMA